MAPTFEDMVLASMEDIKKTLKELDGKVNILDRNLSSFKIDTGNTITDISGKVKGNQELITKDLDRYVPLKSCEDNREHQGKRMGHIEHRLTVIETTSSSNKVGFSQIMVVLSLISVLIIGILNYLK